MVKVNKLWFLPCIAPCILPCSPFIALLFLLSLCFHKIVVLPKSKKIERQMSQLNLLLHGLGESDQDISQMEQESPPTQNSFDSVDDLNKIGEEMGSKQEKQVVEDVPMEEEKQEWEQFIDEQEEEVEAEIHAAQEAAMKLAPESTTVVESSQKRPVETVVETVNESTEGDSSVVPLKVTKNFSDATEDTQSLNEKVNAIELQEEIVVTQPKESIVKEEEVVDTKDDPKIHENEEEDTKDDTQDVQEEETLEDSTTSSSSKKKKNRKKKR